MVRHYKRKTNRQQWDADNMRQAVQAIVDNQMGFQRASDTYHVPKSTLERRVRLLRRNPDFDPAKKKLGRFETVFTVEQETQLVEYIKSMQARLFGLTSLELRFLAFQLAKRNNLQNNFDVETGLAGKFWLSNFLQRHPDLSYRRPEPTSAARAMGFNKVAVNQFYDLLEKAIDEHTFTAEDIYNVDETGISTVPKCVSRIIATKGLKQVGCLTSAERGKTVTVELCFSASGTYMPPLFIFPRMRLKPELLDGAPPGAWGECSNNGWINSEIFLTWFKKFVIFTNASKNNKKLLLLDGHSTHVQNIDVIDCAREHGVVLLCFPPHCTHKLQPLDVAFMKPISTYYSSEIKKWLRNHPGRIVSQFQVARLFGEAYIQSATMSTALNGFRKCGIWPFDRGVFTDCDFMAAETTDIEIELPSVTEQAPEVFPSTSEPRHTTPTRVISPSELIDQENVPPLADPLPSTSKGASLHSTPTKHILSLSGDLHYTTPTTSTNVCAKFLEVSPEMVMPIPKQSRTQPRATRKRGRTVIITESPYKRELEEQIKIAKEKKSVPRKHLFVESKTSKNKKTMLNKKSDEPEQKKRRKNTNVESEGEQEEDDASCLYCRYLYSESDEGWVSCGICKEWAHNSCAGVDEGDNAIHICVNCQP